MRRLVMGIMVLFPMLVFAQSGTGDIHKDFPFLMKRNIFDPDRRAPVVRSEAPQPPPPPQKTRETLKLIGLAQDGEGMHAHFSGSSPAFRSVKHSGETIEGLELTQVTLADVTLTSASTSFVLRVGGQLSRIEGAAWTTEAGPPVVEATEAVPASAPSPSISEPPETPPPAAPEGRVSDLLKRMMERRKKEMAP